MIRFVNNDKPSIFAFFIPLFIVLLISAFFVRRRYVQDSPEQQEGAESVRIGVLPVRAAPLGSAEQKARQAQQQLLRQLDQNKRTNWTVVEPETMGAWMHQLRMSDAERTELLAGQVAGADLVLVPRLVRHEGAHHLQLRLLETVSGNRILRQRASLAGEGVIESLVQSLQRRISSAFPRPKDPIYITFSHPVDQQHSHEVTWRSKALRRRIQRFLDTTSRIRVVHPELSTFVTDYEWSDHIPFDHPRPVSGPIRDPVRLTGRFHAEAPSDGEDGSGTYELRFHLQYRGSKQKIRLDGSLDEGAQLQVELVNQLLSAVAEWRDLKAPDQVHVSEQKQNRYWNVWRILFRHFGAKRERRNPLDRPLSDPGPKRCKQLLKYLDQTPPSPEQNAMFQPVHDVLNEFFLWNDIPDDHSIRDYVNHYPTLKAQRRFVLKNYRMMALNADVGDPEKWTQLDSLKKNVLTRYARYQARISLWGGEVRAKAFLMSLVHAGEGELALNTAISYAWANQYLKDWTYFHRVVSTAVDEGKMDLAYRAYRAQLTLFPGYAGERSLKSEQVKKMKRDDDHPWDELLEQRDEEQTDDPFNNQFTIQPDGYSSFVQSEHVNLSSVTHSPPEGRIVTGVATENGTWCLVRNSGRFLLWEAGESNTTHINGLPDVTPPDLNSGSSKKPSMAFHRGTFYVAGGTDGLWKINASSGEARKVTNGLPEDARVHVVATDHEFLYAGGSSKKRESNGFLVRWKSPGTSPTSFSPPALSGGIRCLSIGTSNRWWFYHHRTDRVTRFSPKSGKWTSSYTAGELDKPTIFASTDKYSLLAKRKHRSSDPVYTVTHQPKKQMKPVYYPPPDYTKKSHSLDRHEWFMIGKKSNEAVRMAPLASTPLDAVSHGQHIFLLDQSGGLSMTDNGMRFTNPIKVNGEKWLIDAGDALGLLGRYSIQLIPYEQLTAAVKTRDLWTQPETLYTRTVEHLHAWLDQQPPKKKSTYFYELQMYKKAADVLIDAPDIEKTDRMVRWIVELLQRANRMERGNRLLKKHGLVQEIEGPKPQGKYYFEYLRNEESWEQVRTGIQYLWQNQPEKYARREFDSNLTGMYLSALQHLLDQSRYEKRLWSLLHGQLPEVHGGWNQSVVMRDKAKDLRREAGERLCRLLAQERKFPVIQRHPLLGTHRWNQFTSRDKWDLYLYTNQPQKAIDAVYREHDRIRAYLYAGRFQEAVRQPDESDHGDPASLLKAALLSRNWETFERAKRHALTDNDTESKQFARRISLLRRSPDAFHSWLNGYKAEFLQQTQQAIQAYRNCVNTDSTALPTAESAFRLGELTWLDRQQKSEALNWFKTSKSIYRTLLERTNHGPTRSFVRYRLGQIAYLVHDDRETARRHWRNGKNGKGYGRVLCQQAFPSVDSAPPVIKVGNRDQLIRNRVVNIDLRGNSLAVQRDGEYLNERVDAYFRAPIGAPQTLFDSPYTAQRDRLWYVYLWYLFSDIRPGFSMVHVRTPDESETVWCLLQRF